MVGFYSRKQNNINRYKSSFLPSALWFFNDGICALEKVHMRSTPSLRSFLTGTVWLTMAISRPFKEDRLALRLSMPLSSGRSMVRCPWLCARRQCLKLLNTSDLPRSEPLVRVSIRRVQGCTSSGVFKGGCRTLAHSSLGFPFYFSLLVASSFSCVVGGRMAWNLCYFVHCMCLYIFLQLFLRRIVP